MSTGMLRRYHKAWGKEIQPEPPELKPESQMLPAASVPEVALSTEPELTVSPAPELMLPATASEEEVIAPLPRKRKYETKSE